MVNRVQLIGNLGDDPEVKAFDGGNKVAKFSLATSETFKTKKGEKKTETEWHDLVIWGVRAGVAEMYLKKGSKIFVEGKIKTESWEKDGAKHYKTVIMVSNFQMLDSKPTTAPSVPAGVEGPKTDNGEEDDLPF